MFTERKEWKYFVFYFHIEPLTSGRIENFVATIADIEASVYITSNTSLGINWVALIHDYSKKQGKLAGVDHKLLQTIS